MSPRTTRRLAWFILLGAAALIAGHLADGWVYQHVHSGRAHDRDWGRLLRVMGFLPTWLLAAAALALVRSGRLAAQGWRRVLRPAALLALGPALAGAAGELLKLLIRRERPEAHDGAYAFRPWSQDPLSTSGLGLPSSHAVVACAAAFILIRLYPRAWPVWLALALGCGLTRLLDRAHFLSDVVAAGVVACAVAWLLDAALPDRPEP